MRRSVLSAVLAASLFVVACSDQPTEVTAPDAAPVEPGAANLVGCPVVTSGQILTLVNDLLPNSPLRASLIAMINALPQKYQDRIKAAVRKLIFPIEDLLLRSFYAGRLKGGTSTNTYDKVLDLIEALHCYVGLTPPTFPATTAGTDVVVRIIFPNVAFDFSTPAGRAGLRGGAGALTTASGPAVITISELPDTPRPLRTSLDQYPRFYLFHGTTATGAAVEFNQDVIAATCLRSGLFDGNTDDLRLAHNVGPDFGDVEVLPRSDVLPTGLTCPDEVGSSGSGGLGTFAWAKKLLLPAELHASSAALLELGVGGTTRKFSEFGIVDQTSNPGTTGSVDESGEPTDGEVTEAGLVHVLVTSRNLTPIKDVPVTFDETTVLTDDDGIASFFWDAEPGTSLTASVPNERDEEVGCVGAIPGHPEADAYRPFVCFTPSSVTFSAPEAPTPGADIIVFNDLNMFDNTAAADLNNRAFYANLVSYTGPGIRTANTRVLVHRGHSARCSQPAGNMECSPAGWLTFEATMRAVGTGYTVDDVDDATAPLTTIASDVKVIILALPMTPYSTAEINALKAFAGEGGRIVFVGEFAAFYGAGIAVENNFLTSMGAVMTNTGGAVDCINDEPAGTYKVLPSSSLQSHQLTAGLTQLTIACASVVDPGPEDYPLFYDRSGELVLGAVAKVDLTPIPIVLLRAAEVTPRSTHSAVLSNDAAGRGIVPKAPAGTQR